MTFDEAARAAGITTWNPPLPDRWDEFQRALPEGPFTFLADGFLAETASLMRWPDEFGQAVRASASRFRERPALHRLLWHAHRVLAETTLRPTSWVLPELGEDAGMFPLFAILSTLPATIEHWNRRGIPGEIRIETLSDVELWARQFKSVHGFWGIENIGWLRWAFRGMLYRLGRLQFKDGKVPGFAQVFRHKTSGRVQLLCPQGAVYDADNRAYWEAGDVPEGGARIAELTEEDGVVRGRPILDDGSLQVAQMELPLADWECLLKPGDPMLDIHIAAGAPMTPEAVADSIARAVEFFPKYLPEVKFRGFVCWAWLLDPVFPSILPPESNIVKFNRLFHVFPVPGDERQIMERVFGDKRPDLTHAPRGEGMRSAVQAYLNRGGRFAGGGGGILREIEPKSDTLSA